FGLFLPILGYGFFVMLSVAVLEASESYLHKIQDESGKAWATSLALRILDRAESFLLTAQTGKFVCGFFIGAISFGLFEYTSQYDVVRIGGVPPLLMRTLFGASLFVLGTIFSLSTVQFAKAISYRYPESVLIYCGWIFLLANNLFTPIRKLSEAVVALFLKLFKLEAPVERELSVSSEDLEEIIEQSTQAGTIATTESELLQGALRLSEVKVKEIMTPRADISFVDIDSSVEELLEAFQEAGFSRILVIGDHLDDVKGMILAKDLIQFVGKPFSSLPSVRSLLREIVFVDGHLFGDEVLRRLRISQAHLGVVLDEHGGVDGIVTLEDLIEEIVGDILDETDVLEDEQEAVRTVSGDLLVDGGISLSALSSDYEIHLPEGEYDTLAGFVIHKLGRIPTKGEKVRSNGCLFRVEQVEDNRVLQLRISGKTGIPTSIQ
ncbi:MAG: HlyC/CorC family transporter, partial [Bdellovibrionales bacterium]|nr:HlyC/CorC family transporter [Bdellovibrionales bacterium]